MSWGVDAEVIFVLEMADILVVTAGVEGLLKCYFASSVLLFLSTMAIARTSSRVVALFAFLSLALLVMETDAQCEFYTDACQYKNTFYGMFEMWDTDSCEWCMCEGDYGYMCCSKFDIPVDYDSECEVTKDYDTCQTKVVDQEGNECEVFVGVL